MNVSAPRCPDCDSPRWAPHATDCPKYKRPANEMPKLAKHIEGNNE